MADEINEVTDDQTLLARLTGHDRGDSHWSDSRGGDEAFASLVLRHRDFVHRVCRRVLGNAEAAEDATQQVFIILARRARTLAGRTSIAGWLYRTAWQVSLRTRRGVLTRLNHERAAARQEGYYPPAFVPEADSVEMLHDVVGHLPDAYREVIVLHYFGGCTVAEAAARLKIPAGTVASRISRGLRLIRTKLGDRGLIITAVALKAVLLAEGFHAKAAMAGGAPLAQAAVRAALRWRVPARGFRTGVAGGSAVLGMSLFGVRLSAGSSVSEPVAAALKSAFQLLGSKFNPNVFGSLPTGVKAAAGLAIASLLGTTCYATVVVAGKMIAGETPTSATARKSPEVVQIPVKEAKVQSGDSPGDGAVSFALHGASTGVPEPAGATVLATTAAASVSRRKRPRRHSRE
jgi:RNA polymerase sigma factor (sigma-70 family)